MATIGETMVLGDKLAAADLSAKQYYIGQIDSDGKVALGGDGKADGIIMNAPASGVVAKFAYAGKAKVICAEAIDEGAWFSSDANGKAVAAVAGDQRLGKILTASTADGDIVDCLLSPGAGTAPTVTLAFPITLADITGAGDVVTGYVPGFVGSIESVEWIQGTPVTTGSKAADLNVEIGTTNVTGGVVSLTSAACTPLGKRIAGTAVTAANTFNATDAISVEAATVTAFAEGAGTLYIKCLVTQ